MPTNPTEKFEPVIVARKLQLRKCDACRSKYAEYVLYSESRVTKFLCERCFIAEGKKRRIQMQGEAYLVPQPVKGNLIPAASEGDVKAVENQVTESLKRQHEKSKMSAKLKAQAEKIREINAAFEQIICDLPDEVKTPARKTPRKINYENVNIFAGYADTNSRSGKMQGTAEFNKEKVRVFPLIAGKKVSKIFTDIFITETANAAEILRKTLTSFPAFLATWDGDITLEPISE